MVISKANVWLVVQKIDSTLDQFKKKNTGIWSCDYLLDNKYKIIVRDIIAGVIQLVKQGYMGELKIQDIAIINGRAKLMRISNELGVSKLRNQLQNLLEDLLGNDPNNKELVDFYSCMKTMQMCKLIHLRNHPMLLTSQERLQFPVLLLQLLNYEKKSSNWKAKYDRQYRDEEVKKAKRLEKDQEYKVVYDYKSDQEKEVNYIATKVEKDQAYKNVYDHKNRVYPDTVSQKKKGYPNTASSQITFSRNVIVHINDDGQYRTGEEVGKKLKNFFPDLWTRLFSFMISEGIDVWDQRNEKYGGDLLSNCRATLKLCILENDDLATGHFLKICRLFVSLIDMRADKSKDISSLVTKIKGRIITVESKFLQDQFKYRKLEEIIKDDNVSGTSTKCIKFLMRFLKFIELFLRMYALNADGDVKGMFETAYSSLLEDDPDLKKKRKMESLKKHTYLLESVPSSEEFKSLLGNPKSIKDSGKTVAESLTILTGRWDKLSNEMNANKKQSAGGGIVATTSAVAVSETTARTGEAGIVAASSGDSMVAATGVGDSMVAASSGHSMVATTSSGDSTIAYLGDISA
ncbi:hypothetical protein SO802_029583 [Lithocarpus litseifolius]|uniref:Glycolipid transfer protein domain-containing protein n=1 Tax=Lithocarpus litseifolius TaxID=425828 RepID=A0AAW2BX23_9ROSI